MFATGRKRRLTIQITREEAEDLLFAVENQPIGIDLSSTGEKFIEILMRFLGVGEDD